MNARARWIWIGAALWALGCGSSGVSNDASRDEAGERDATKDDRGAAEGPSDGGGGDGQGGGSGGTADSGGGDGSRPDADATDAPAPNDGAADDLPVERVADAGLDGGGVDQAGADVASLDASAADAGSSDVASPDVTSPDVASPDTVPDPYACAAVTPVNTSGLTLIAPDISARKLAKALGDLIRIDRDPLSGAIVVMSSVGDFWRLDPASGALTPTESSYSALYRRSHHDGMTFGPDGTLYVVETHASPTGGETEQAIIRKGVPGAGGRTWSALATTAFWPASNTQFDHGFTALAVSPDGQHLYVSAGARSDHGEYLLNGREQPLTGKILRLPTSASGLSLPNDEAALGAAGRVYAAGLANTYDLAFNAAGDLIGPENGPDADFSDELNWIQEGKHYGFPWRFGSEDSPVTDPTYSPIGDLRLHAGYISFGMATWSYDAAFPARPSVTFTDPILNVGPDADRFRIGKVGAIRDASEEGIALAGISGHRSPLGLSFDSTGALCGRYRNAGFMVSFGAVVDVFADRGKDLVLVQLTKGAGGYQMRTTQLASGMTYPLDSLLVGNKLYVIEPGGGAPIYELTFPPRR